MNTKNIPEFLEYFIYDLLEGTGISCKKLFNGWGIYYRNKIFAIYVRLPGKTHKLYFKETRTNQELFDKHNTDYFEFYKPKSKNTVRLKYRELPEEFLDEPEKLWEMIIEI